MSKFELLELLHQDIEDVKGLIEYDEFNLTKENIKKLARGIILNLEEHLEEFIQE